MDERDKLPAKTNTRELAVQTELSGSLVARGLADIDNKQPSVTPNANQVSDHQAVEEISTEQSSQTSGKKRLTQHQLQFLKGLLDRSEGAREPSVTPNANEASVRERTVARVT
jgi:hypothetical protein